LPRSQPGKLLWLAIGVDDNLIAVGADIVRSRIVGVDIVAACRCAAATEPQTGYAYSLVVNIWQSHTGMFRLC